MALKYIIVPTHGDKLKCLCGSPDVHEAHLDVVVETQLSNVRISSCHKYQCPSCKSVWFMDGDVKKLGRRIDELGLRGLLKAGKAVIDLRPL